METNRGGRTEGCWADVGHSGKERPRQREQKAAWLTQDRGNWRDVERALCATHGCEEDE